MKMRKYQWIGRPDKIGEVKVLDDASDGIIGGSGQWEVCVTDIMKILQFLAMLFWAMTTSVKEGWRAGLLKDRKKS